MTCITGIVQGGEVWIGGDSAGVSGYDLRVRGDEKVFQVGEFLFGICGSFRVGQILRYRFTPPPLLTWDVRAFMATDFVDAARTTLKEAGCLMSLQEEARIGGSFLVGVRGELFEIDCDLQFACHPDGFGACGAGAGPALGALHATEGKPARDRVRCALEAAERFCAGVRSPFVIRKLEAVEAQGAP